MFLRQCDTASQIHQVVLVRHEATQPVSRILYLLDGNAALAALRPEWLAERPDIALAAIGYPDTEGFDLDRRSLDYTPPPAPQWDGGSRKALARPHGGAGDFLAVLTRDIVPAVEQQLGISDIPRELWGHSYGGLFALWMLAGGGGGFSIIHAASPSLWWDDYALEQQLLSGAFFLSTPGRLDLSIGDSEVSRTGERLYSPARLAALATALRRPGLDCTVAVFPGASHGDSFALALERAIRLGA